MNPTESFAGRVYPWKLVSVTLLSLAAVLAFARLRTWDEPINRDLATYAMAAREFLGGRALYTDLWDLKPPAIFWTYALAQKLVGYGQQTIYFLTLAGSLVTMLGVYAFASAWSTEQGWKTGLAAAFAWAVVSGTLSVQGNEPNTECFINAFVTLAFACVIRILSPQLSTSHRSWLAVLAGLFFAAGSLYKTVVVAQALAGGLLILGFAMWRGEIRTGIKLTVLCALAAVLPWTAVIGGYFAAGAGSDFLEAVFTYNLYYARLSGGGMMDNLLRSLHPANLFPDILNLWIPLGLLVAAGIAAVRKAPPALRVYGIAALAYLGSSHVAMAMPGHFSPHYYQLLCPPLCLGAAAGMSILWPLLGRYKRTFTAACALSICVLQVPNYLLNAEQWSLIKYGGDPVYERAVGRYLDTEVLKQGETIYQWGSALTLLYEAGRPLPSGIFFIAPVLPGPALQSATEKLIRDLDNNKPALLVVDARDVPPGINPVMESYFDLHYRYLAIDPPAVRFKFYVRKGSEASQRSAGIIEKLKVFRTKSVDPPE